MKEGDVILVPLPQADGQRKPQPAILLRILPPFGDFLVCGVSSQLRQQVRGLDELILRTDMDFAGSVGEISPERHHRVLKQLAEFLVSTKRFA
jgi:mRNA interferase MazF